MLDKSEITRGSNYQVGQILGDRRPCIGIVSPPFLAAAGKLKKIVAGINLPVQKVFDSFYVSFADFFFTFLPDIQKKEGRWIC